MKNLATVPAPLEFNLTVLNGKDKGAVYRLMSAEISLGRGTDNDISFPDDPTCSRKHARIKMTPEGFKIESLSEKNSLSVDGQKTSAAVLTDGNSIELGNTTLRFNVVRNPMAAQPPPQFHSVQGGLQTAGPQAMGPAYSPAHHGHGPGLRGQQHRRKKTSPITPMRIIIGIVALLGIYLATAGDPAEKKKLIELRTNQSMEADIEAAKKQAEAIAIERREKQPNSQAHKEAQGAFVRGFRDHQKGLYGRAMESFQACLSLSPDHVLCNRYLRLSQRKFNELTQYHMVLGRKYKAQNQFSACASAFSNVMVMIRDQNNKTYQEAKANYDACHLQVQGRF